MHFPKAALDAQCENPRTKLILHIIVGVILLPVMICGGVRISGGSGSNVIGMVSHKSELRLPSLYSVESQILRLPRLHSLD